MSTPAPKPQINGPFSEAEVSIYFDESRQEGEEKKRIFITPGKEMSCFISLVYTQYGLASGTAFSPDGEWLRKMEKSSTRISP